jgi:hypothetical protein
MWIAILTLMTTRGPTCSLLKGGGPAMRRIKRFVQVKKRETQSQIARQCNGNPPDELVVRLLEGRLEAFRLLEHYLDRLEEEEILASGSASAFSPHG